MVSSIGSWLKQNAFHWRQCTGLIFIIQSGPDFPACNEERASSFCTRWSGTAQAKGDSTPAPLPAPGNGVSSTLTFFSTLGENYIVALLHGEGNGTPLQYSCLENPMEGGAWKAAGHGVAKSRIRLSDFTLTCHFHALEKAMATHFQCSCLENPRDGTACWAAISGVAQSRTRLKWLSSSSPTTVPSFNWFIYYPGTYTASWRTMLWLHGSADLKHFFFPDELESKWNNS